MLIIKMTYETKYQIIAVISGILRILSFTALIYTVQITKETDHLTLPWILLILASQCLLVIYGVINNSYGIYVPATILIFGVLYILYIKLNYNKAKLIDDELRLKNIL